MLHSDLQQAPGFLPAPCRPEQVPIFPRLLRLNGLQIDIPKHAVSIVADDRLCLRIGDLTSMDTFVKAIGEPLERKHVGLCAYGLAILKVVRIGWRRQD